MFLTTLMVRGAAFALLCASAAAAERPLDYGRDVRPILSENCFHCHGQDSSKRMAGLRLDTAEGARVLKPGDPDSSELFLRINSANPAKKMPPAYSNRSLTQEQIATLRRWIAEGAKYSRHWAFTPPVKPELPSIADRTWVKQPIDAFVRQRLEVEGLRPSPAAVPATWLRRASLDLTGLPPSPGELEAFSKDVALRGEDAYRSAAGRMLDSPRYGERMATDWLDVARYADTHGFNNDAARSMWRWRDWVIHSFNSNMPYDWFITDQLAGDLLPNASLDQRIATGFGRNHVINSEGGIIDEEYRVEYVADRVRTLGMAWLGLSLECSRCHDHKYDPITQRDHYRFYAFFNNVPEIGEDGRVANAVPMISAPTAEQQKRLRELEPEIKALSERVEGREKSWTWREGSAARALDLAPKAVAPADAVLKLDCDSGKDFAQVPGVAGQACQMGTGKPVADAFPLRRRGGLTFSMWLNPAEPDRDVPILSTADYAKNPAATGHGSGLELRLIGGELEFRFGQRFPAYSLRVRSEGASIKPGQWSHVVLVYSGAPVKSDMRAYASWVRMFASGREIPFRVLNDGFPLPDEKSDKGTPTKLRVGWDNSPQGSRFAGLLDETGVWNRALNDGEIWGLFASRALPYAVARQREGKAGAAETAWVREALLRDSDNEFAKLRRELERRRAEWLAVQREAPTVMVMEEMSPPRATHVLVRGSYSLPGEKVEPGVPEDLLGTWPQGAPKNRLGLAMWLTKPDHPMTARVVVNRFWQQLFGQGLVKTTENFGVQGDSPSHPELLDWLAREFIDSGWDVKALMKIMVLSAAYRQDSSASKELIARDPENRLLARGPRFRVPAEVLRDQALTLAGLLKHRLGGPSVNPYQPAELYKGLVVAADYPGTSWVESKGDDLYRRSLYTFWKRTVPHPTMTVFDAPDREFCIVRRSTTNTPLQALTLLNDPIFVEAARKLGERAYREGGASADSRIAYAFRLATGRAADGEEKRVLRKAFDEMWAAFKADESKAAALLSVGAAPRDAAIPVSELAAYAAVANMILNLDEVVTKG